MSRSKAIRTPAIFAGTLLLGSVGAPGIASRNAAANDFTAEKVMKEMKSEERRGFVVGVVEGLAVARYFKDGKKPDGMNCIYDWYFEGAPGQTLQSIYAAFERYPAYPPGSIVYTLTRQKCGE